MSKKTKKIKVKEKNSEPKGPAFEDRLPSNRGEWILLVIRLTERVIKSPPSESDEMFINQVCRLKNELQEWKKINKNKILRQL